MITADTKFSYVMGYGTCNWNDLDDRVATDLRESVDSLFNI